MHNICDSIVLNKEQQMLMALLRAVLNERAAEKEYFEAASPEDWKNCCRLAVRQGVVAMAWDAVLTLPENLRPPLAVKLKWGLVVEGCEKRYAAYCRTVDRITRFYAGQGIATVQLKGVGYSVDYPVPSHREGGDIDIYTYSAEPSRWTDEEANRLADSMMTGKGIHVDCTHTRKHSNFDYEGIPIENHRYFLNIGYYEGAEELNALLLEKLRPVKTGLMGGKYEIYTPSPQFNALFLILHAAQHYGNGLSLHHLLDWAVLLKKHGWMMPEEVTDRKILRFAKTLTVMCEELLGIRVQRCEGRRNRQLEVEIWNEMMDPPFSKVVPVKGVFRIIGYKIRRFRHRHRISQRVLTRSWLSEILASIRDHIKCPASIWDTGQKK